MALDDEMNLEADQEMSLDGLATFKFSLLKADNIPDDALEINPENEGTRRARLYLSNDEDRSSVYLEVVEPKIGLTIWKKPARGETWLSFFVMNGDTQPDTDIVVVERGIYRLHIDGSDDDDLGTVTLELYLQP
jgi:hypothetical protein